MSSADRLKSANIIIISKCTDIALRLSKDVGALEQKLMETKWFDYRFMSPLDATELFVESYKASYRRKWGVYFSTIEGSKKKATRIGGWRSSPTEFTSFWKARQFADQVGVPYEFFCDCALESLLRRGWERPARPNQLYSEKNLAVIVEYVVEKWREHCSDVAFMISTLPQYHLDNFDNQPAQHAHQDWVVEQIRLRHMSTSTIRRACFEECVLPLTRAQFEFRLERVERAQEEASTMSSPRTVPAPVAAHELRPSCFGILHAYASSSPACEACAFNRGCSRLTDSLAKHVVSQFGIDDPVLARTREMGRQRISRHRAKHIPPGVAASAVSSA
jgi:hypothetical protein